jgi:Histone chaperone domain CHZ
MAPSAAEEPEEEEAAADLDSNSDSDAEQDKKSSKKRKSSSPKTAPAPKAAARTYSKKIDRMRSLCRQATITIPPNIYVKNKTDSELEDAFEALLNKNGLGASSGPNEVAKVKAQLQIQRDLDGIDTSNIISDGRRSRRGAGATNYK